MDITTPRAQTIWQIKTFEELEPITRAVLNNRFVTGSGVKYQVVGINLTPDGQTRVYRRFEPSQKLDLVPLEKILNDELIR